MANLRDDKDGQSAQGEIQQALALLAAFNAASNIDRLRTAGDNADGLATRANGILRVLAENALYNGATLDLARGGGDNADALTALALGVQRVGAANLLWNGANWDRRRGNFGSGALITHVGAAVGINGADQVNHNGRGVHLVIDITAITGTTPSLTVTLQGKDPVSGKYYTILASAVLAAVATTVLKVYPGLTAAANLAANDILPREWRVISAIAGTTPAVTATVAASVIL